MTENCDVRLIDAMCRNDFVGFAGKCFNTLLPGSGFLPNWHIEAIAYQLEQVRLGKIKRLIITLPPRYLKSLMGSVAFPAFIMGHDPTKRVIVVSYSAELAVKFTNDFRAVVSSRWYRRTFPRIQISPYKNTETEVSTTLNGFRLAASIDGTLTGRGGDIIIVDDPLKAADALSDNKRKRVNDYFNTTIMSRLDNKRDGAIIIIMQRLHPDDLVGVLLEGSDSWTVLNLPAIAEQDGRIKISDSYLHHRHIGDVLHPEREPQSLLESLRTQLGSEIFAAQYQQSPVPPGGAMIKQNWIRRYDQLPSTDAPTMIIQSWDTASKTGIQNDFSVCTTWMIFESKYYLKDDLRGRFDYPTLKARAIDHAKVHRADKILIEDTGAGTALISELQDAGLSAVGVKPEHNKQARMYVQCAKFEAGRVYLPNDAPWLEDLEAELFAFPYVRHDDQVDSISQALAHEPSGYQWDDKSLKGLERLTCGLIGWPYRRW